MTPDQLIQARLRLGLSKADMAKELQTPYRTYQNWELGLRRVPGVVSVALHAVNKVCGRRTQQPSHDSTE